MKYKILEDVKMNNCEQRAVGDRLAIPFFALLFYYFFDKPFRTDFENVLFAFVVIALAVDVYWTATD